MTRLELPDLKVRQTKLLTMQRPNSPDAPFFEHKNEHQAAPTMRLAELHQNSIDSFGKDHKQDTASESEQRDTDGELLGGD